MRHRVIVVVYLCVWFEFSIYNNELAKKTSALQNIELKRGVFHKIASLQSCRIASNLLAQLSAILFAFTSTH